MNLNIQTIEMMAKIYQTSLSHIQKLLNYRSSVSEKDIQQMLDIVFEQEDLLNEDDKGKIEGVALSNPREEATNINEVLGIKQVIDLDSWVFIDNSELPVITYRFDDSDDNEDWNPDTILGN
jgi:5'-3' exonuclease